MRLRVVRKAVSVLLAVVLFAALVPVNVVAGGGDFTWSWAATLAGEQNVVAFESIQLHSDYHPFVINSTAWMIMRHEEWGDKTEEGNTIRLEKSQEFFTADVPFPFECELQYRFIHGAELTLNGSKNMPNNTRDIDEDDFESPADSVTVRFESLEELEEGISIRAEKDGVVTIFKLYPELYPPADPNLPAFETLSVTIDGTEYLPMNALTGSGFDDASIRFLLPRKYNTGYENPHPSLKDAFITYTLKDGVNKPVYGFDETVEIVSGSSPFFQPENMGYFYSLYIGGHPNTDGYLYANLLYRDYSVSFFFPNDDEPWIYRMYTDTYFLPTKGGDANIYMSVANFDDASITVGAFLPGETEPIVSAQASIAGTTATAVVPLPANTSERDIAYTIKVSLDGGKNWLETPTTSILVEPSEIEQSFYTLTYDPNNGSGGPATREYNIEEGVSVVFDPAPTRGGHNFLGWATSAGAANATYTEDGDDNTFTITKDTVLYAVWGPKESDELNLSDLESAIADAEAAMKNVAVSEDGSDVPPDVYWVPSDTMDSLVKTIEIIREDLSSELEQDYIVFAFEDLIGTIESFNATKRLGNKADDTSDPTPPVVVGPARPDSNISLRRSSDRSRSGDVVFSNDKSRRSTGPTDWSKTTGKTDTTAKATQTTTHTPGVEVSRAAATSAVKAAVQSARASGTSTATARLHNPGKISYTALQDMVAASSLSLKVYADTLTADGKAVDVRLTLNPSAAKTDLNLSASTSNSNATACKDLFGRWFNNRVSVVSLGQKGSFGQTVRIAAKLDSGLDPENLVFYSYDNGKNSYSQIKNSEYRVDTGGYVHFNTELAGDIVISDGALAKD